MTKDEALKHDGVQAKPEPERVASQEPVAWMHIENYINEDNLWDSRKLFRDYDNGFGVPLYTTPPQRTWVGLTDDEFEDIELGCRSTPFGKIEAMRMVEAKLKEKNT